MSSPVALPAALAEQSRAPLEENGLTREDLTVSVGLPGPAGSHLGMAVRPPLMPGWDGFGVCRFLAERRGCDVIADNDVNLKALGEAGTPAAARPHRTRCRRRARRREQQAPARRGRCRCGNHGCLDAIASTGPITPRLGLSENDFAARRTPSAWSARWPPSSAG
ncbi:ROK family protein [Amycolatopsis methanolica]|uniref:ROK family protein n=1 Tax=Amycolatopsis methanolica TaxID=1814 RepID=UPI00039D19DF